MPHPPNRNRLLEDILNRQQSGYLVDEVVEPLPRFFVNVASKELRLDVSGLESTFTDCLASVDSKEVTAEHGIPLHRSVEMKNAGKMPAVRVITKYYLPSTIRE